MVGSIFENYVRFLAVLLYADRKGFADKEELFNQAEKF
jgi:hypothetical protein